VCVLKAFGVDKHTYTQEITPSTESILDLKTAWYIIDDRFKETSNQRKRLIDTETTVPHGVKDIRHEPGLNLFMPRNGRYWRKPVRVINQFGASQEWANGTHQLKLHRRSFLCGRDCPRENAARFVCRSEGSANLAAAFILPVQNASHIR
jgi:hypothetical protein